MPLCAVLHEPMSRVAADGLEGWGGLTGLSERFHEQLLRVMERAARA